MFSVTKRSLQQARNDDLSPMQYDTALDEGHQDNGVTVKLLNDLLSTEIICVLKSRQHHFMAKGIGSEKIAQNFMRHSKEQQSYADLIAERIVELNGEPNFSPGNMINSKDGRYESASPLLGMIKEDLFFEHIAIDIYSDIIRYLRSNDPTTKSMLENILTQKEQYASKQFDFFKQLSNTFKTEAPLVAA
jgi:bacterioferritin